MWLLNSDKTFGSLRNLSHKNTAYFSSMKRIESSVESVELCLCSIGLLMRSAEHFCCIWRTVLHKHSQKLINVFFDGFSVEILQFYGAECPVFHFLTEIMTKICFTTRLTLFVSIPTLLYSQRCLCFHTSPTADRDKKKLHQKLSISLPQHFIPRPIRS